MDQGVQFDNTTIPGHRFRFLKYVDGIDLLSGDTADMYPSITSGEISGFIRRLKTFGCQEHHILVLIDRFIGNKTFQEITNEHGFVDARVTYSVYKQGLKLAKAGYERKKKNG